MRIEQDPKLDYDDVLIRPKRSTLTSRKDVSLERTYAFPHSDTTWTGVPVIAANMDGVGTKAMSASLSKFKMLTALHKYFSPKDYEGINTSFTFVTTGIQEEDFKKLKALSKKIDLKLICIDAANGYTEKFVSYVAQVRKLLPNAVIMAGNVVTGEMTEQLILSGADIVKVGIGPGSACTTRKMTGIGYPQLSAVMECADAAHGLKGLVCADGGCKVPGDVVKGFAAGADFVMLGGMLAGHDESEFELIEKEGKKFVEFYGSSSAVAMSKHYGGKNEYRAAEGRHVLLPYKGKVAVTIEEILGGLRSACTYVGAEKLKELPKRTTFILVNRQLNTVFADREID